MYILFGGATLTKRPSQFFHPEAQSSILPQVIEIASRKLEFENWKWAEIFHISVLSSKLVWTENDRVKSTDAKPYKVFAFGNWQQWENNLVDRLTTDLKNTHGDRLEIHFPPTQGIAQSFHGDCEVKGIRYVQTNHPARVSSTYWFQYLKNQDFALAIIIDESYPTFCEVVRMVLEACLEAEVPIKFYIKDGRLGVISKSVLHAKT